MSIARVKHLFIKFCKIEINVLNWLNTIYCNKADILNNLCISKKKALFNDYK